MGRLGRLIVRLGWKSLQIFGEFGRGGLSSSIRYANGAPGRRLRKLMWIDGLVHAARPGLRPSGDDLVRVDMTRRV